jgi:hypothetical protein
MSICVGDSGLVGAAVFAAPVCARDSVHRQRRGVNDPGMAPQEPPRRRPRGRSRPVVIVSWSRAYRRGVAPRIGARCPRNCVAYSDVDYATDPMVVLRCTRKLLVRLKLTEVLADVPSTTRLGDWYGNILHISRRQYLLLISERSRLPVVISIRDAKRLETIFPDAVAAVLAAVGIADECIADERSRMSKIAFGPTMNRSLLGTLNDFAFMAQQGNANRAEPESPGELMRFLSQTPILPLNGASPIELTRAVFQLRTTH